jgi:hypothetical protein
VQCHEHMGDVNVLRIPSPDMQRERNRMTFTPSCVSPLQRLQDMHTPKGTDALFCFLLFFTCYLDTRTHTGWSSVYASRHRGHHTRYSVLHDIQHLLYLGIHSSGGSLAFARNMLYHWEIGRTSAMQVIGNVVCHRGCGTQPAVVC